MRYFRWSGADRRCLHPVVFDDGGENSNALITDVGQGTIVRTRDQLVIGFVTERAAEGEGIAI